MPHETVTGTCEGCGKSYRIPSADKAFRCKACGGTVRAHAEDPEEREEREAPVRPHAPLRRTAPKKTRTGWILLGVFLALGLLGYGLFRTGLATVRAGAPRDLELAGAALAEAWDEADVEQLVAFSHPAKRGEHRQWFARVAQGRGWQDGFPRVTGKAGRITEGDEAAPKRAQSILLLGDEARATFEWQYEASFDCWFCYHVSLTRPPLAPRVAGFRAAWTRSSPQALAEFFTPNGAEKMVALVEKKAVELGWSDSFPELGEPRVTSEEEAREPIGELLGGKIESVFPTALGELEVRWRFHDELDRWYVSGFGFPKGG